ncbi:tyrosine-type recombinase/integrase [Uniformispora flossi]|uniref:tyrosine-type recombinase/integrase n=1 Tax=Uniformispora flossi TaxID=3390723 RepID=UPI003C2F5981
MGSRHGKVARTPVSPRDPRVLAGLPSARSAGTAASPGRAAATRAQLGTLAEALLDQPSYQQRWRQNLALTRVLDWLETFPGEDWQDRWLLSGAEDQGSRWGPQDLTPALRNRLTAGLGIMIALRAVRPSYAWLSRSRLLGVYASFRRHNQAGTFADVERYAARHQGHEYAAEAVNVLTRMVIVTGKPLRELDLADFGEYTAARQACGSKVAALPMAYDLLRAVGGLEDLPPTLREAQARGQMSVAELVDRYPVANKEIRDVLVHYLVERSAALDYGSLVNLVQVLVDLFWRDLERHHPGICSLHLPGPVAQAWKQRIRTLPNGQARRTFHSVLLAVRAFYLDLLQWSLEDPARWARWAAPSPVGEADIRGYIKETRRRQARMQQRTRTLIPVLPQLIAAAEDELDAAGRMLSAARDAAAGEEFTIDGQRYRRTGRGSSTWRPSALFVTPADQPGPRFDAERLEDNAFWTFAAIEVLRRTGTRIEELLELTHVSLRQYQAPTGEMVPLLQVSPSKTDAERVIPAAPDLVAVLARIIRRIKRDGTVPLLSRYDGYERTFGPPLPHLFQRTTHHQLQVIPPDRIRELLAGLARRAGITDVDGTPLTFTPHDFRRIFSTETVNGGLPIHIAAKLLGHLDLNTTQGYVAVYPEEVIRHYRQFVDQRRTHRPSEEYREPTDTEWDEFRDHFSLRKVALGRCDRPYGTPCQHESACVRCPMLHMSLNQVPRLLEIERNTHERLDEARRLQWLGEVANLQESLRHIADKKRQAERLRQQQADQGELRENALS